MSNLNFDVRLSRLAKGIRVVDGPRVSHPSNAPRGLYIQFEGSQKIIFDKSIWLPEAQKIAQANGWDPNGERTVGGATNSDYLYGPGSYTRVVWFHDERKRR